jgi:hypothetical protein
MPYQLRGECMDLVDRKCAIRLRIVRISDTLSEPDPPGAPCFLRENSLFVASGV